MNEQMWRASCFPKKITPEVRNMAKTPDLSRGIPVRVVDRSQVPPGFVNHATIVAANDTVYIVFALIEPPLQAEDASIKIDSVDAVVTHKIVVSLESAEDIARLIQKVAHERRRASREFENDL
jgi:hypothetical protein